MWADTIFYSETDTTLKIGLNLDKSGAFGFYYVQSQTGKVYKWETLSTDINGGYDSNETGATLGEGSSYIRTNIHASNNRRWSGTGGGRVITDSNNDSAITIFFLLKSPSSSISIIK